ncbi:Signal transduction histidine kinase [Burkholderiales bacterium 8X]|nr:Signal transduction histidine kinase [Burkholderiales bacterium 8X]
MSAVMHSRGLPDEAATGALPMSAPDARDELDQRRLQLVTEQAVGLRWEILLTAATVFAIAWRDVPWTWLAVWFAGVIVIREWRAAALLRLERDRSRPIAERLRLTVVWNFFLGMANGSAAIFMLWLDPTLDAVLTMILVSWGAGAVSTSAFILPAFLSYASWLFVPTALMWATAGNWLGTGVAVLVMMFFGVQLRFAKRNLRTFEESFGIRLENVELARRLAAEGIELAAARDAAVQADLGKSGFLAAASHDLRQPLQAMSLNSGELMRLAADDDARSIARDIVASIDDLRSMLDGLLDVSKLDAGGVAPESRDLSIGRLVEGVCNSFRAAASARGLAIDWQCPPGLVGRSDPELLRRILANLVDNALKFTQQGGVQVTAEAVENGIRIEVRDTGIGIAAEDQGRVFDDLVQVGNPERNRAQGHGLGLGIVRRLARLLGIGLELESRLGQGSVFRLQVPRGDAVERPEPTAAAAERLDGCRILVLDDAEQVRSAYRRALEGLGAEVHAAGNLAEALDLVSRLSVDVAVVDYRLAPGVDGIEAVEALRRVDVGLAAVLVTADTGDAIVRRAEVARLPMLRKPVDAAALAHAVNGCRPRQGGREDAP